MNPIVEENYHKQFSGSSYSYVKFSTGFNYQVIQEHVFKRTVHSNNKSGSTVDRLSVRASSSLRSFPKTLLDRYLRGLVIVWPPTHLCNTMRDWCMLSEKITFSPARHVACSRALTNRLKSYTVGVTLCVLVQHMVCVHESYVKSGKSYIQSQRLLVNVKHKL